jgi:hypothetical protein
MKLDPESLTVDSFDLTQNSEPFYGIDQPSDDEVAGGSRYCSLVQTCGTCWHTRCNCA